MLLGKNSSLITQDNNKKTCIALSIASSRKINLDEVLKTSKFNNNTGYNVKDVSLKVLIAIENLAKIISASQKLPDDCINCKWRKVCNGGELIHRYKSETEFNNKSIMCDGLKIYFDKIANTLIDSGIEKSMLRIEQLDE